MRKGEIPMQFQMVHNNINVLDLEKAVAFYQEAFGMEEISRKQAQDGSFILVFMACPGGNHKLELTWLRDKKEPYNLGDNEIHLAFETDDFEGALAHHRAMGCVCFENTAMGVYFVSDPDGYWSEVVHAK